MKRVLLGIVLLAIMPMLAACGESVPAQQSTPTALSVPTVSSNPTPAPSGTETTGSPIPVEPTTPPVDTSNLGDGKMIIETSKGRIVLRLFTDPSARVGGTILNFAQKAQAGVFNGLNFHRVEDWVVQGGDPVGNGTGGGDMPSEFNNIPFSTGSLGVARGMDPAINNDSQFFITKKPSPHLNGQYTNWGQVTEGQDVVDRLAVGDKINSITIEGVGDLKQPAAEPERVTVQHILIGFKDARGFQGAAPPKAAERTREQAKALANQVLTSAKGGESFDELVAQHTDDSPPGIYGISNFGVSPAQGEFGRDGMVPAFGNVGFGLQVGEIAMADYDDFTSPFGWHIIKRVK